MKAGGLFEGIGGISLGLEPFGIETIWHVENDKHASAVLEKHWPGVPNYEEVAFQLACVSMPRPRNDKRPNEWYSRYQDGLSLAEVAVEFGVKRQTVYDAFARRGWPMRPKPTPLPAVEFNSRRYTMRNMGYYGCTTGDRHLLHRAIWEFYNGPIPNGWDVHHKDGNKTNNRLDNFECLPKAEHTRLYSPNCNQHAHKCGAHS